MVIWQFVKDNFGTIWGVITATLILVSMAVSLIREMKWQQDDDQYIP
ncbi:hypothetical protein [Acinetobacter sp. WU_MDCI_Abxb74]|nr:hypothetical protein [Acinetobacter sp. WU_MDCI_Abxb74]MCU4423311.1 hypothetical protein [Acinetobacter sp. WU_MDCI_Abxb74]